MEKDVLVILMVAFGLFAIIMFVLFFVYLKKYYNSKHLEDDYQKEIDRNMDDEDIIEIPNKVDEKEESIASLPNDNISSEPIDEFESDMEFVPIKKK